MEFSKLFNFFVSNKKFSISFESYFKAIPQSESPFWTLYVTSPLFTGVNMELFLINGVVISDSNPGYLKIGDEIIKYSGISNDGKTITVATSGRGAAETTAVAHAVDDIVECYNLDGIPLTELNKTHTSISCPWLDTYMLHTTSIASGGIRAGGGLVYATQNVQFETLTPQVSVMDLPETTIAARINTTSATSI